MTKPDNKLTGAIVAGFIGLLFIGYQTSARNDQTNIDNLPAFEARLEAVESQQDTVDGQFDQFQAQLDRRIERELQGQIDRRFGDVNDRLQVLEQIVRTLTAGGGL